MSNRYETPPRDTEYYKEKIIDWGLDKMYSDPTGPLDEARIRSRNERYEVKIWRKAEPLNSFLYLDKHGNILRLTVRKVVPLETDISVIDNGRTIEPDFIDGYVAVGLKEYRDNDSQNH